MALGIGIQPLQSRCDRKGARKLSDLAFLSCLSSADASIGQAQSEARGNGLMVSKEIAPHCLALEAKNLYKVAANLSVS